MKNNSFLFILISFLVLFLIASCDSGSQKPFLESFMGLDGHSIKDAPEDIQKQYKEKIDQLEERVSREVKETEEYQLKYKQLANAYIKLGDLVYEIGSLEAENQVKTYPDADGDYYKLLALSFIDREMYEKAFEALKKAILAFPQNDILYQLAGASAGWVGKSYLDPGDGDKKDQWLELSRDYYLRSLELNPINRDSLYGISILYAMELSMPGRALVYLNRLIEKESRYREALLLRAIVYYQLGHETGEQISYLEKAMDQYNEIIKLDFNDATTQRAIELKDQIAEEIYGSQ